jgi:hypothetical protein
MPRSHFDFDMLHDVLYQDKDYEVAYLGNRSIAKPGDLAEWFEDFQAPAPRILREGSAGKRCRPRQRRGSVRAMQPRRGEGR